MARLTSIFFPPKIGDVASIPLDDLMILGNVAASVAGSDAVHNFPSGPGFKAANRAWADANSLVRKEIVRREEESNCELPRPRGYFLVNDVEQNAALIHCLSFEQIQ